MVTLLNTSLMQGYIFLKPQTETWTKSTWLIYIEALGECCEDEEWLLRYFSLQEQTNMFLQGPREKIFLESDKILRLKRNGFWNKPLGLRVKKGTSPKPLTLLEELQTKSNSFFPPLPNTCYGWERNPFLNLSLRFCLGEENELHLTLTLDFCV